MDRRTALLAASAPLWRGTAAAAAARPAPRVLFLNPGEPAERGKGPHWRMTAQLMGAAARNFGMQLEVLFAERDHLLMLRQAEEVSRRPQSPDYIVIVNQKLAAPQMLKLLSRTTAKVLVIHNDLTPEQRREVGNEREQLSHWIGTVTTSEESAHARLMAELYRQLGNQEPRVVGITGDRATPVSLERAQGIGDHVARAGRGQVLQTVFSDWSVADAESKVNLLLARYPETNVLWAGNDAMAIGALRAVKARAARVLVGGSGGWPDALASLGEQGLAATVGCHFFIGAWAMVLLHDHHRGHDFADHGGTRLKIDYMQVVNRESAARFDQAIYQRETDFDFGIFSKVLHPRPGRYEFSLAPLLRRS
jgi:ABC-type sugar transport system substrate-binding protein